MCLLWNKETTVYKQSVGNGMVSCTLRCTGSWQIGITIGGLYDSNNMHFSQYVIWPTSEQTLWHFQWVQGCSLATLTNYHSASISRTEVTTIWLNCSEGEFTVRPIASNMLIVAMNLESLVNFSFWIKAKIKTGCLQSGVGSKVDRQSGCFGREEGRCLSRSLHTSIDVFTSVAEVTPADTVAWTWFTTRTIHHQITTII